MQLRLTDEVDSVAMAGDKADPARFFTGWLRQSVNRVAAEPRSLRAVAAQAGQVDRLSGLTLIAPIALAFAGGGVWADTEIHRCLLEDGTFAFQETPCTEPAPPGENAPEVNDDAGLREQAVTSEEPARPLGPEPSANRPMPADEPPSGPVSRDRGECEKTTRDAIDAIDLELRANATKDQRSKYLAELLALTEQLRACKQL